MQWKNQRSHIHFSLSLTSMQIQTCKDMLRHALECRGLSWQTQSNLIFNCLSDWLVQSDWRWSLEWSFYADNERTTRSHEFTFHTESKPPSTERWIYVYWKHWNVVNVFSPWPFAHFLKRLFSSNNPGALSLWSKYRQMRRREGTWTNERRMNQS